MSDEYVNEYELFELKYITKLAEYIDQAPRLGNLSLNVGLVNERGDQVVEIRRDEDGDTEVNFDVKR